MAVGALTTNQPGAVARRDSLVAELLDFFKHQGMGATKELIEQHHGAAMRNVQQQQVQEQQQGLGQQQNQGQQQGQQPERKEVQEEEQQEQGQQEQQQQLEERLASSLGWRYVVSGFPIKGNEDAFTRHKTDVQLQLDLVAVAVRLASQICLAFHARRLLEQAKEGVALRVRPRTLQAWLLAANLLCVAPCLVSVVWFRGSYWRVRNVSMAVASLVSMLSAVLVLYARRGTHTSIYDHSSCVQQQGACALLLVGQILLPVLQQPTTKTLVFMALAAILHTHCVAQLLELSCAAEAGLLVGGVAAQAFLVWLDLRLRRRFHE